MGNIRIKMEASTLTLHNATTYCTLISQLIQYECLQYTRVEILVKYVLCHLDFN